MLVEDDAQGPSAVRSGADHVLRLGSSPDQLVSVYLAASRRHMADSQLRRGRNVIENAHDAILIVLRRSRSRS